MGSVAILLDQATDVQLKRTLTILARAVAVNRRAHTRSLGTSYTRTSSVMVPTTTAMDSSCTDTATCLTHVVCTTRLNVRRTQQQHIMAKASYGLLFCARPATRLNVKGGFDVPVAQQGEPHTAQPAAATAAKISL